MFLDMKVTRPNTGIGHVWNKSDKDSFEDLIQGILTSTNMSSVSIGMLFPRTSITWVLGSIPSGISPRSLFTHSTVSFPFFQIQMQVWKKSTGWLNMDNFCQINGQILRFGGTRSIRTKMQARFKDLLLKHLDFDSGICRHDIVLQKKNYQDYH